MIQVINKSCLETYGHDEESPFVFMPISAIEDKSISPKAKGVLLYLLSLPRDSKINNDQLAKGLGVGAYYANSCIQELIHADYVEVV